MKSDSSNTRDFYHHLFLSALALVFFINAAAHASHHKSPLSINCAPFPSTALYSTPQRTTLADPSNWIEVIEKAHPFDEVLLRDGHYLLDRHSVVLNKPITLRGASGIRGNVVIEGTGYKNAAEALMVTANNVQIADLAIQNVRDHAIAIQEGFANTVIYNVDLINIGTQHIKGNRMGESGLIACSRLGYTKNGGLGDYNAAIDLHGAINWTIRDNIIYNIYGDGSGCNVDKSCGTLQPGGEPAILLWRNSHNNHIDRNTIVDSYRGISLGLGTPYSGGTVRNNFICRSNSGRKGVRGFIAADTGISLLGANNVLVEGNTLVLPGDYAGQIEVRNSTGNIIVNNVLSKKIWNRGGAVFNQCTKSTCIDTQYTNLVTPTVLDITCPTIESFKLPAPVKR